MRLRGAAPHPRSHGIISLVKSGSKTDLYRKLPSVDELLRTPVIADLISREGPAAVTESARAVLSRLRDEIGTALVDDESLGLALSGIPSAIERELQQALRYSLRTVINATGVILHTNLGRDRRIVPDSRHHGKIQCHPSRGGYY